MLILKQALELHSADFGNGEVAGGDDECAVASTRSSDAGVGVLSQRGILSLPVSCCNTLSCGQMLMGCKGDPYQPNWQETFYGANYKRLRSIKAKYDPHDIFYATTAVGSDDWEIEGPGRLCRVAT